MGARAAKPALVEQHTLSENHGVWVAVPTCMPAESKVKFLTSASPPWAGISWPFRLKLTPAAFPTRMLISREARTEVCAGAIRVSWVTSWPSEKTEIQEFSVARIISDSAGADFWDGEAAGFSKFLTVTSFGSSGP